MEWPIDNYLWKYLLVILLLFALYMYLFPGSIDFFTNPDGKKNNNYPVEVA